MSTHSVGRQAEARAAKFLEEKYAYKILQKNYTCRLGEIDLIAEERGTLVFAEVRLRSGRGLFGGAAESVTAAKRARLIAAARLYLARRPEADCRFDVFLIDGEPQQVRWIRDAFGE